MANNNRLSCKRLVLVAFCFLCFISITAQGRSLHAAAVENIDGLVPKDVNTPKEEGTMEADDDFSLIDYSPAKKKTPIHN
ncbi:hypothetical protein ACJRO7_033450 [Eucalyptus globulus]|uniref:Root meristem growth factor 9 n=1 Tax=Eucalyptus globulus TaxID=34317 RepID=A0ABD3JRG6_EUCGL